MLRRAGVATTAVAATILATIPMATAAAGSARAAAIPAPAEVTEFNLPDALELPGRIIEGPDGGMWSTASELEDRPLDGIARDAIVRISANGELAQFPAPADAGQLTAGPYQSVWFLGSREPGASRGIWRISASGAVSEAIASEQLGFFLAYGPDGNFWSIADTGPAEAVQRVTPAGEITEFPIPTREAEARAITVGPDRNLWFVESKKIGRVTTSGSITEFPLPAENRRPWSIAGGPDGNLWFAAGSGVGRITPAGDVVEIALPEAKNRWYEPVERIAAGPDGRMWMTGPTSRIVRINPFTLGITEVRVPRAASNPRDVAQGPGGTLWYLAEGDYPCEGGGSTCWGWRPGHPAIVGRIRPGALRVRIEAIGGAPKPRRAGIRIACGGGSATSVCRGRLTLFRRSTVIGGRRYRLPVDTSRMLRVPLTPDAAVQLRRRHRLRVTARATVRGSRNTRRAVALRSTHLARRR